MQRVPISKEGYTRLQTKLQRMKTSERRAVADEIEIARAHGDLRENADYDAAKEKQGILEAHIRDLDDKLARADVIDTSKLSGDRVVFGATVTLYDVSTEGETKLTIVGELEAKPKEGLISVTSPLARALIGKRPDDEVRAQTPGGIREYEVVDVSFG